MIFFAKLGVFLGVLSIYALTVFFVSPAFYLHWSVGGVILVIFWFLVGFRLGPSRKKREILGNLTIEYQKVRKMEADTKDAALGKEFICPSCKAKENYWSFLNDGTCKACGSGLWTTGLGELDDSYLKLFKKKESIDSFYDKMSPSMLRRVKNQAQNT